MRRFLILCAAILFVACATEAFAEVQNIKVSGDIAVTGVSRNDFDLGSAQGESDSNVIMSQARVRIDADLTDNVSATIRILNERDWDKEDVNDDANDMDLDLAYITMKEMLYAPLTVTVGRQNFQLGNGFVLGDPDTNRDTKTGTATSATTETSGHPNGLTNRDLSLRKAFDAIRTTLDYDPLTIDFFYAKMDEGGSTVAGDKEENDVDLYAINAAYELDDDYGTIAEGYVLYKRNEITNIGATLTSEGHDIDTVYCPGFRISTNPIENLNLQAELAWQFGNKYAVGSNNVLGNFRDRRAMAGQIIGTYALDVDNDLNPVIGLVYSYYSGEKDPVEPESKYTAWDPLYENQTAGHIINVLYDATNSHSINLKASVTPMEDVTIRADYVNLWLDKDLPVGTYTTSGANILTLYNINGGSSTPVMTGNNHLGHEIDLGVTYDYTEDVQLGLLFGYYIPGNAFDGANKENATELLGSCKVLF